MTALEESSLACIARRIEHALKAMESLAYRGTDRVVVVNDVHWELLNLQKEVCRLQRLATMAEDLDRRVTHLSEMTDELAERMTKT